MTVRLGGAVSSVTASGAAAGVDRTFGYPEKPGAFQTLVGALQDGSEDVAVQILGDSTGNDSYEWVQQVAARLAALYPAYNVNHLLWDDAIQAFDASTVVRAASQVSPYGMGTRSVAFTPPAIGGGYGAYIPGNEIAWFAGDIDVRVRVALTNWTPAGASDQCLLARFGAAPLRAFRLSIDRNSAKPSWTWSTDGTTLNQQLCPAALPAVNGQEMWVRVTHQMNDGAGHNVVTFWWSAANDGLTWTQLGQFVNAGAIAGLINPGNAQNWELGARQGNLETMIGVVSAVEIRDGIAGPTLNNLSMDAWHVGVFDFFTQLGASPTLTFVNCSKPGADITYLTDATRFQKATRDYNTAVVFLSCSHNDGKNFGPSYLTLWDAWLAQVRARFPRANVVVIAQNPRTAPATNIREHAIRRRSLIQWAARNSLTVIDVYRAFLEAGAPMSVLVDPADGIHPTVAGQQVWTTAVMTAIQRRV